MNSGPHTRPVATRRPWWAVATIFVLGLALLTPLPNQYRALWTSHLLDASHVPAFALITVCAFLVWRVPGAILLAALAGVAVVAELAQGVVGRSTNLVDVVRSWAGIALGVSVLAMSRHGASRFRSTRSGATRSGATRAPLGWFLAAVLLVAWPLAEAVPAAWDAWRAWKAFPVLTDFSSPWQAGRWATMDCQLRRTRCRESGSGWAGLLCAERRNDFGVILLPVVSDWSGYQQLHFVFEIRGGPATILLSVRDGVRVSPPTKRFDRRQVLSSGVHDCVFSLSKLSDGDRLDRFAPVNIARIQSVHFHVLQGSEDQTFLIHQLYLD